MKQLIHNYPDKESFIENCLLQVRAIDDGEGDGKFDAIFMAEWHTFIPVHSGLLMYRRGVRTYENCVFILFGPTKSKDSSDFITVNPVATKPKARRIYHKEIDSAQNLLKRLAVKDGVRGYLTYEYDTPVQSLKNMFFCVTNMPKFRVEGWAEVVVVVNTPKTVSLLPMRSIDDIGVGCGSAIDFDFRTDHDFDKYFAL